MCGKQSKAMFSLFTTGEMTLRHGNKLERKFHEGGSIDMLNQPRMPMQRLDSFTKKNPDCLHETKIIVCPI